jgi:DNA-binding NarL/FixJ family response regulator
VRVLLGAEQQLGRAGLARLLGSRPGLRVVADAGTPLALMQLAADLAPNIAVLNPALAGAELATVHRLRASCPDLAVLLYDVEPRRVAMIDALRAGIRGFVDRQAGIDALAGAVVRVAAGDLYISPSLVRVLADAGPGPRPGHGFDPPTGRELDILRQVASGRSNREVALALGLSEHTVRAHLRSISRKLEVRNRFQAVAVALQSGLLDHPTSIDHTTGNDSGHGPGTPIAISEG